MIDKHAANNLFSKFSSRSVMKHRSKKIAFIAIDKTASTYFESLLSLNGFVKEWPDSVITCQYDIFAFMLEPQIRYAKALVEDLFPIYQSNPEATIEVLSHPSAKIITDHCDAVIPHYIPGDFHAKFIDWIPLEKSTSLIYLKKLFEYYELPLTIDENLYVNESDPKELEFYNNIKEFTTIIEDSWLGAYYHKDLHLWKHINKYFTPIDQFDDWDKVTWDQVSCLKYHSQ
jgi:hypothetical protein